MPDTTPERRWRNVVELAAEVRRYWPDAAPTFVRRDGQVWPESVEYRMPDGRLVASAWRWSLIANKRLRIGWDGRIGEGIEPEEIKDMTKHPELFAALAAPFQPHEVKQRTGSGGRQLDYITAATAANRLDDVLGPEQWDFDIKPWGDDSLIGTLTLHLPDGTSVRKSNVGGKAGMQAEDDDAKSAASDCFKRCAVLAGVGRYLHRDGVPAYAVGTHDNTPRPESRREDRRQHTQQQRGQGQDRQHDRPPRSGRAMFAWSKAQEERIGKPGLIKYLNGWAKERGFPFKMTEWSEDEVKAAHTEALNAIRNVTGEPEVDPDIDIDTHGYDGAEADADAEASRYD